MFSLESQLNSHQCITCLVASLEVDMYNKLTTIYYMISDTLSKDSKFYLIWFAEELKYSVVEGKYITEVNPKTKDKVHIKDTTGTWQGIVYASGMLIRSKF